MSQDYEAHPRLRCTECKTPLKKEPDEEEIEETPTELRLSGVADHQQRVQKTVVYVRICPNKECGEPNKERVGQPILGIDS